MPARRGLLVAAGGAAAVAALAGGVALSGLLDPAAPQDPPGEVLAEGDAGAAVDAGTDDPGTDETGSQPSEDTDSTDATSSADPGTSDDTSTQPAEAFAAPRELCDRVSAADFTEVTGLDATLDVGDTRLQCDYALEEDGRFARVTARVPEDFTTWSAYLSTQPDDPDQTSYPDLGDGALVLVVDSGDGSQYVTAEVLLDSTVVTWELALPGDERTARAQATELLERVAAGA